MQELNTPKAMKLRPVRPDSLFVSAFVILAIITLSAKVSLSQDHTPLARYDPIFSNSCGPVNLYFALRLLGTDANLVQILQQCNAIQNAGQTSFTELKQAAEGYGVNTFCAKMNLTALKDLKAPALLHLINPREHFVVYAGWVNEHCKILDATGFRRGTHIRYMQPRMLKKNWDGSVLVLSKEPVLLRPQPALWKEVPAGIFAGAVFSVIGMCLVKTSSILKQRKTKGAV